MSEVLERVEKILLAEKSLIGKDGELVPVKDIIYLVSKPAGVFAAAAGKKQVELPGNLSFWEKLLRGLFIQTHRQYLVALDRIEGTFERFPAEHEEEKRQTRAEQRLKDDECEISLRGTAKRIPVTAVYGKALKKTLGITRFHYLAPENPIDRNLRLYGLIDFGWRELYNLDTSNKAAVAGFQKKWDIKQFSKTRMLSYFRLFGVNEINTKRVIKNLIYQTWRWIKKGIEKPSDGNIRSMWYKIKSVLATHSNILGSGDVDTFYSTLQEMIEEQELFRYKDFGFMDMNEPYRVIGAKNPEIILASEKIGQYLFIKGLADAYGLSFLCLKGEPARISMEYFSDDLQEKCGGRPLTASTWATRSMNCACWNCSADTLTAIGTPWPRSCHSAAWRTACDSTQSPMATMKTPRTGTPCRWRNVASHRRCWTSDGTRAVLSPRDSVEACVPRQPEIREL